MIYIKNVGDIDIYLGIPLIGRIKNHGFRIPPGDSIELSEQAMFIGRAYGADAHLSMAVFKRKRTVPKKTSYKKKTKRARGRKKRS